MKPVGAMTLICIVAVFLWVWQAFGELKALSEEELDLITADPTQTPAATGSLIPDPPGPRLLLVFPIILSNEPFAFPTLDTAKGAQPDLSNVPNVPSVSSPSPPSLLHNIPFHPLGRGN